MRQAARGALTQQKPGAGGTAAGLTSRRGFGGTRRLDFDDTPPRTRTPIMPHWKKSFPSKFLQTADLDDGPITATINTVGTENVGDEDAGELKLVVSFKEGVKRLVCNLTRAEAISEIAGSDNTDDWPGTVIQIVKGTTRYQGRRVGCLVVQAPPKPAAGAMADSVGF